MPCPGGALSKGLRPGLLRLGKGSLHLPADVSVAVSKCTVLCRRVAAPGVTVRSPVVGMTMELAL